MKRERRYFKPEELVIVGTAASVGGGVDVQSIGRVVRLNSGGPDMLVVDFDDQMVTVAFVGEFGPEEFETNRMCVHKV